MTNLNPSNTQFRKSSNEYYAAKAREYAAEARDLAWKPGKWPTVVTVTKPDGKSKSVYTSVEWQGFK